MGGVVKSISKVIKPIVKVVTDTVDKVIDFAVNVTEGVLKNVGGMIEGALKGDWNQFRDSIIGSFQTTLYGIAGVIGVATGQIWLTAASIVALDGQYNEGQLTAHAVKTIGRIEKGLFGSEYILDNVDMISTAIVIVGSLYSGAKGFTLLADIAGVSSILSSSAFSLASGGYAIYEAYDKWQYALELYDNLMADYQKWLAEVNAKHEQFNRMWDAVYGDLNVWYEAMPGGYLFNAGVGSDEYSISSINEQCAYSLALDTKRDVDFDKYFTDPFEIDYVGLNIDDIKPDILKFEE
ncbi:hypothetical protein ACNSOO_04725 [Aliarcobacter lanthieri]|uniref:hypothetical protein n=1 Tax=Aliarcobacter lanthieri TaxID=1355374 RepID=UPI003AABE154